MKVWREEWTGLLEVVVEPAFHDEPRKTTTTILDLDIHDQSMELWDNPGGRWIPIRRII